MLTENKTAILLFSRTAAEEAAVKTFHPSLGKKGNKSIAQALISNSLSILKQTGLPIFTTYSHQQKGNSFGERLANAIESIYKKGYENVITIGNNCPALNSAFLLEAIEKIQQEELVFGPAEDGGLYLVGLQKKAYQRQDFIELPWKENSLQKACYFYAQKNNLSINWLERLKDINGSLDLTKFLKKLSTYHRFKKRILSIFASFQAHIITIHFFAPISRSLIQPSLRAPPC